MNVSKSSCGLRSSYLYLLRGFCGKYFLSAAEAAEDVEIAGPEPLIQLLVIGGRSTCQHLNNGSKTLVQSLAQASFVFTNPT
jgi:hypothetical protein